MIEQIATATALRREAVLLEDVARHPDHCHLFFWQGAQSLVAPEKIGRNPGFERVSARLGHAGWPVHLRNTGGDVTPQGPGIVNVTLVYALPPGAADIAGSFERLCSPIEHALGDGASRGRIAGAFCDGAHNVLIGGRKFAGTAQRFRRCYTQRDRFAVLAHALMLIAPVTQAPITAINSFLRELGEPRVIRREAHGALPAGCARDEFLSRLMQRYQEILPATAADRG